MTRFAILLADAALCDPSGFLLTFTAAEVKRIEHDMASDPNALTLVPLATKEARISADHPAAGPVFVGRDDLTVMGFGGPVWESFFRFARRPDTLTYARQVIDTYAGE